MPPTYEQIANAYTQAQNKLDAFQALRQQKLRQLHAEFAAAIAAPSPQWVTFTPAAATRTYEPLDVTCGLVLSEQAHEPSITVTFALVADEFSVAARFRQRDLALNTESERNELYELLSSALSEAAGGPKPLSSMEAIRARVLAAWGRNGPPGSTELRASVPFPQDDGPT